MKVAIWDTYVQKKDGSVMHFDIIVPHFVTDELVIIDKGKLYLSKKGQEGQPLTSKECHYCHMGIATDVMKSAINAQGYYILELENCSQF
ncbi:DUF2024 family protein [Flavobacterium ustbae]|uniref:DUF2024 family protein n=1 Tax=Flavobacterium ustbae TaxID=2488790 RepID=UPI000F776DC8|nr:DUF2024 family protein [Flavobacterium ustbae]